MINLLDLDLESPARLRAVAGETWVLVWAGDRVLGERRLPKLDPMWESDLRLALAIEMRRAIYAADEYRMARTPGIDPADVSIVVCTKDRPDYLEGCLTALGSLDPAPGEIVVVDNASRDERTRGVADAHDVRYVWEPIAGLNRARNAGVEAATKPIVAFVDDDARVHPRFVAAVARGFSAPGIAAVTGLVMPAELLTYPQIAFERLEGGMRKGFEPLLFHRDTVDIGLEAFRLGVGTNMAFRTSVLEALGGFDPSIGVGTASRGGGDIEMLYRVYEAGLAIRYEPSAVVRHIHRRRRSGLVAQMRDYGISFAEFLDRRAAASPEASRAVARYRRRWRRRRHLIRGVRALRHGRLLELEMALAEWAGSVTRRPSGGRGAVVPGPHVTRLAPRVRRNGRGGLDDESAATMQVAR